MRISTRWAALALALPLLAAEAEGAGEGSAGRFDEAVEVRLVNVDVVVLDKKGRFVSGLGREDFELYVDSKPVAITHFAELGAGAAAEGRGGAAAGARPAPPGAPAAELEPGEDSIHLAILVDARHLEPAHRARVLPDLEAFLRARGSEMASLTLAVARPRLEVLVPPTRSVEAAVAGLHALTDEPTEGHRRARREVMRALRIVWELNNGCGPEEDFQQLLQQIDVYAARTAGRMAESQAGLVEMVRALAGLPGRKALVYVSDGLEQRPGLDLFDFVGSLCDREREVFAYLTRYDAMPLLAETAAYANAHRVTLYPLEAAGLVTGSSASVEAEPLPPGADGAPGRSFVPTARNDDVRVANLQGSLHTLALETGGEAILNANRPLPDLERLASGLRELYSLAFEPPVRDGREHTIRVALASRVKKAGRIRHRLRYRDIPERERLAERTVSTLALGVEDDALGVGLAALAPSPLPSGAWEVPIEIALALDRLTLLPSGEGVEGSLRIHLSAENERRRRFTLREKVVPVRLAGDAAAAAEGPGRHAVVVRFELEPGDYRIALGIRDELSGLASFRRLDLAVGAAP